MSTDAGRPEFSGPPAYAKLQCQGRVGEDCGTEFVARLPPKFNGPDERKWARCPECGHPTAAGPTDVVKPGGEDA